MKKIILFISASLILLIIGYIMLIPTSLEGKRDFKRKWINYSERKLFYFNLDYNGYRLWIEYPLLRGTKGKVVTPAGAIVVDKSGVVDGKCSLYYVEGPFAGLKAIQYPYKNGRVLGVVSFWNNDGKVIRQEKWSDDRSPEEGKIWTPEEEDIVEVKVSPPWWDNIRNQIPPDGVYTKTVKPYSPCHTEWVIKQRKYLKGKLVESRDKVPWLKPDPGFWRAAKGIIIYFRGAEKKRFMLNNQVLTDGQILKIQRGPQIKIHFKDDEHLEFILQEDYNNLSKGSYVEPAVNTRFEL